jgi:hypothetical protein
VTPLRWDFRELLRWYRMDEEDQPTRVYNSFKSALKYPYFMGEFRRREEGVVAEEMVGLWNRSCEELLCNHPNPPNPSLLPL